MAARSGMTLVGVCLAVLGCCLPAAAATDGSPLSIKPIEAVFVPDDLGTRYTVSASEAPLPAGKSIGYTWTLTLKLVDKAGAPAPGESGGAAVDPTCDNSYLPGAINPKQYVYVWVDEGTSFVWYHGDVGSYLNLGSFGSSEYGCDHSKMGPSGHQGVVTVAVDDGTWICTESIAGTNLGLSPQYGGAANCSRMTRLEMQIAELQNAIGKTQKELTKPNVDGSTLDTALRDVEKDFDEGSPAYADASTAQILAFVATNTSDESVRKADLTKALAGANKVLAALIDLQ